MIIHPSMLLCTRTGSVHGDTVVTIVGLVILLHGQSLRLQHHVASSERDG